MDGPSTGDRLLEALPIVERILGFIRRRNRLSAEESEELGSYVRLKLVERGPSIFGKFGGRSTLGTYLAVIVQRLFLDFCAERPGKQGPLVGRLAAISAEDPVEIGEDRATARRVETALRLAISRLPEQDRLIVRLHFVEGMTVASVALLISVRQKPLYRRVERILATLRKELEAAGIEAGRSSGLIGRREFGIGWHTEGADAPGNAADEPSKEG